MVQAFSQYALPLAPVAVAYALGVVFADRVSLALVLVASVAFAVTLVAIVVGKARPYLIMPAVFLTGATLSREPVAANDLRKVLGKEPRDVIVRGVLTETPYQRISERAHAEVWKTIAKIETSAIYLKETTTWMPASGTILISSWNLLPPEFFHGQAIEVQGIIRRPETALAPGLFSYRDYLRRVGIHYQLFTQRTNEWLLLSGTTVLPISDRFHQWGKKMLARGLPEEDENVHLLWAMTLGWKTALSGEVAEPFMRSGTMHVFAVSGLHITLIAGILFAALQGARVPRQIAAIMVIGLLWAYTYITGWQSSGIRSAIMSSVLVAGYSIHRPANMLNSLAAAALLILVWDPQQLFQAGFQLSFCVVLSLLLFTPVLDAVREKLLAPDPFLPRELRPKWRRWVNYPLHYLLAALITSFAAWVGSLPVIAYYFHLFNPISLIANLIVVPISSAALACNVITLSVGWLAPPAAELLNYAAWGGMWLMVRVSEWAAGVRWGVYQVCAPNLLTFIAYYVLLAYAMLKEARRVWFGGILAASLGACAGTWFYQGSQTVLTVLPLEGGSAIYVKAEGKHLLIDCGNQDSARWITKPFLQARGVNGLSDLVLTHGDVRHVEAAPRIHHLFPAEHIYRSPVRFKSLSYRKVLETLEQERAPTQTVAAGDQIGAWRVLHPVRNEVFPQADDNAMVLLATISGKRVLLLSDLGRRGQSALLNRYPDLRADIIITGLPRESEPVSDTFLDAVQPELIIVCDSEYPPAERASEKFNGRLAKRIVKVAYASDSGAVTLAFQKRAYTLQAARNRD